MYATAFIHNLATGRIHVAYFSQAPFPGGPKNQPCIRWRSRGHHHTVGAKDQEEADAHRIELEACLKDNFDEKNPVHLGHMQWDGEGTPAMSILG